MTFLARFPMSLDRSLKGANALIRHRNVLTRAERLLKLTEEERWDDSKSVYGLPKVAHRKQELAKAEKEADATAAAGAVPGATPAAGAAAPAAGAAKDAKGAAPAAKGAAPAAAKAAAPAAKKK
jgi:small basic protein (TIGR04137 family)